MTWPTTCHDCGELIPDGMTLCRDCSRCARIAELESELADMRTQYELLCDDYRELDADVTALRARCTRQDGDPTVEQVRDIMEIFNAECVTGRVFRVALRAWGEEP